MKSKVNALTNLNINPCKMCMPMGSATAFYGLKKCMTILHGSQGCATYIRRHMATHYNEPVDIASSSLTEQGTVYGGSENLKKGLKNLITLYEPSVIGVMTTCLAETIGEDVKGIIDEFYEENEEYRDITIIPVASPGYGGTQYDGYFATLNAIVSNVEMYKEKNEYINVVTPLISPADTRWLKEVFEDFQIPAIFLPDLSENLDGGHKKEYNRLPQEGTDLADIKKMGGAKMTIEFSVIDKENSPGKTLEERYGVPCSYMNLPAGFRDVDSLLRLLSEISGKEIPLKYRKQRERFLDGMVDSHKYNSQGRAVVFGEPDYVFATVRTMCESGVMPVVCATGSKCPQLKELLEPELKKLADMYFVDDYEVMDNVDFKEIEEAMKKYEVNLMVGNSDGRRIAEETSIPLIRRGFPIHDHIGGQRLKMLGYEGSQEYLDEMTNVLIDETENSFRETLYETYYKGTPIEVKQEKSEDIDAILKKKTEEHPCYNCGAHKFARIHLPVAPSCNVQCKYCVRKYDCANESRPGVTSDILTPLEALERYRVVKKKVPNLTVVGIAGPGDALANWEQVKETFELIRKENADATFCLSTNGLLLPNYAEEIANLGVSHVTVTLNAVDPHISGQIYRFVTYNGKKYEGDMAGALMVTNQLAGIRMLIARKVIVKVNIVTVKGINDAHVPEIVKTVKELGCFITNIMQMIPVKGSDFEGIDPISNKGLVELRKSCEKIMPQMYHCKHCRADAVGTLDNDQSLDLKGFIQPDKTSTPKGRYRFAVASKSGINVDMHFGHAKEFYIYDYKDGEIRMVEKRNVKMQYCGGQENCGEEDKITTMIQSLHDCQYVLAMRIGLEPQKKLISRGITAVTTFDRIEDAVCKLVDKMTSQLEKEVVG